MRILAPFSDEQVRRLNEWQLRGDAHSFTCAVNSGHHDLLATRNGWICEDCGYKQDWAHDFMVNSGRQYQTTEIKMAMTRPSYYSSTFTIEEILGFLPISPKVGDTVSFHEIGNLVVNGCSVAIRPPSKEEKEVASK